MIKIETGKREFDEFYSKIKSFLEKDTLDLIIDNEKVHGYRSPDSRAIWLRDHSDMFRGFRYFETDLKSTINHFAATQAVNGRIFDFFTVFPDKSTLERENWAKYVRVPVEADVEFRFVKAAYLAWQATGDDDWLEKILPSLEKALAYTTSHPWRWEPSLGLVKRAYTIDTWDFAYTAGKHDWLQFQIDDDTFWGIMHGDNSGYFEAFEIMRRFSEYFGNELQAEEWKKRAQGLKQKMNEICWNGKFYTHFVKLTPVEIPGVDEANQLSLSNAAAINRGAATHEMAVSIIREYLKRKEKTESFAEWFSIDPAFPDGIFGDEKLVRGAYINGGIYPLVGGELARAAFEHGFENYGVDILRRYFQMIDKKGETYLWYFPDGSPSSEQTSTSPEATPTDGWGSSAMLYGFIEGLAGVRDQLKLFEKITLSPRWLAAEVKEAQVKVGYQASNAGISYHFKKLDKKIILDIEARESDIDFHILLPKSAVVSEVKLAGERISFHQKKVQDSEYVDFNCFCKGKKHVEIFFS